MKHKTTLRSLAQFAFISVLALSWAGCNKSATPEPQQKESSPPPQKIRVRLTWLYQASYVPFLVAKEKGFYAKRGLDVEVLQSGPDLRPITPVVSGEDQFGVEGASSIIQAAANKVPLVVVGTYLQKSAEVFMARQSDNLKDIKDWRGKKVGVWIGTHVEPLFYAMLDKAGVAHSDVQVVPAKYDIAPFLQEGSERVPIWNAYIYNEAQIPVEKGIPVDIITPESIGIRRAGEGIFASRSFVEKNPEIVKQFIAATIEGINYTVTNQDEAIQILTSGKYGSGFDVQHQKNMLKAVAPLLMGDSDRPLATDVSLWQDTATTSFLNPIAEPLDVKGFVQTNFVEDFHLEKK